MKYFAIAALLGLLSLGEVQQVQAIEAAREYSQFAEIQKAEGQSDSDSESESDDGDQGVEEVQIKSAAKFNSWLAHDGAPDFGTPQPTDYPHWMDGFGGYHTYKRDIPDRFESEADDTLMRSLYKNYATEGKADNLPNGHFWVTKPDGKRVAKEVVMTHLHLNAAEAEGYLGEHFETDWAKYDVNEEGKIEVDRAPMFLRTICGDSVACMGLQ